eukprot:scaffold1306_cov399-Prasinococcus_capsulatus_cf.AAC.6
MGNTKPFCCRRVPPTYMCRYKYVERTRLSKETHLLRKSATIFRYPKHSATWLTRQPRTASRAFTQTNLSPWLLA